MMKYQFILPIVVVLAVIAALYDFFSGQLGRGLQSTAVALIALFLFLENKKS